MVLVAAALSAVTLLSGTLAYALEQVDSVIPDALEQVQFAVPKYPSQSLNGDTAWDMPPHPDATGNLIFNSVSSLMQLWPNIVWRHGHTMALTHIPVGTLLHHGLITPNGSVPTQPDWLAFDQEHSYIFGSQVCRLYSFMTTRDVKLLYFDGNSAANEFGMMETADLIAWGKIRPDRANSEYERIVALCEWAKPRGLDGFIRMEFHFEVMYCDFSDGLELVDSIDLLPKTDSHWPWNWNPGNAPRRDPGGSQGPGGPGRGWPPSTEVTPPTGWRGTLPTANDAIFQAVVAGSWHHRAPGETRVVVDWHGAVTFYDPALTSLIDARRGLSRTQHSLASISQEDIAKKLEEVSHVVTREGRGSGVNWGSIMHVVIERYSARLVMLNDTLAFESSFANATSRAASARAQLLVMLTPYFHAHDFESLAGGSPANSDHAWLAPIAHRCARTQTSHIPASRLTYQEELILHAVQQTTHEICRRLALMWSDAFDIESADEAEAARAVGEWGVHTKELMDWLDWSSWQTCRPGCKVNEFCYTPTWPFVVAGDRQSGMAPRCVALNDASVVSPGWGGPGGPGGPGHPGRRPGRGPGRHDPDDA
ncbi:hypothetical protein PENSPDRAFT_603320 [Peniophora sp. CONT]|nr:hypothetical protein PENSPDRAFT_603320 [Peniophora sp. CONT]